MAGVNYPLAGTGGYTGNDSAASDNVTNMKSTENNVIVTSDMQTYLTLFMIVLIGWFAWSHAK